MSIFNNLNDDLNQKLKQLRIELKNADDEGDNSRYEQIEGEVKTLVDKEIKFNLEKIDKLEKEPLELIFKCCRFTNSSENYTDDVKTTTSNLRSSLKTQIKAMNETDIESDASQLLENLKQRNGGRKSRRHRNTKRSASRRRKPRKSRRRR